MTEYKFTLNPFKGMFRNPVINVILEKKTHKILYKSFCVEKSEKDKFKEILKEFNKKGKVNLKKHKTWWQNFKGYDKYTLLNGENIPIIEYEFTKK